MRRQHVGGLLSDRPRSHNRTEEEARPAICHHTHRRDRSQTAGFGCKLCPPCLTVPKPKLNKVHYAAHIAVVVDLLDIVEELEPRQTGRGLLLNLRVPVLRCEVVQPEEFLVVEIVADEV